MKLSHALATLVLMGCGGEVAPKLATVGASSGGAGSVGGSSGSTTGGDTGSTGTTSSTSSTSSGTTTGSSSGSVSSGSGSTTIGLTTGLPGLTSSSSSGTTGSGTAYVHSATHLEAGGGGSGQDVFQMGCDASSDPTCQPDATPMHRVTLTEFHIEVDLVRLADGGAVKLAWPDAEAECERVGMSLPTEAQAEYVQRVAYQAQPALPFSLAQWTHDWYSPGYSSSAVTNPTGPGSDVQGADQRSARGGTSDPTNREPIYETDLLPFRCAQ